MRHQTSVSEPGYHARRIAAEHAVVSEDRAWFESVCRRVERETRSEYDDLLQRIADHIDGGNVDAALALCRGAA